jgi:hypothetical protein
MENNNSHYSIIDDTAKKGLNNILHYFDRIHDKLFTINNILIAGYFASSKIFPAISMRYILIPFINLVFLVYLEYRMMELSRSEANILETPIKDLEKRLYKKYPKVTLLSFLAILSTSIVTITFLILILN